MKIIDPHTESLSPWRFTRTACQLETEVGFQFSMATEKTTPKFSGLKQHFVIMYHIMYIVD